MPQLNASPTTIAEPVTDTLHGIPVADPFRWLEDQNSPRTREWLAEQSLYARGYLDNVVGREAIRERIHRLLDIETYDSLLAAGQSYYFRKRLPGQQQPCIYMRETADGVDQMLLDPATRATGNHTAIRPLLVSQDGCLLLYEVKQGGEQSGTFEIFDLRKRETVPDILTRGHLFGFAFAPDSRSFYYAHEPSEGTKRPYRAIYHHMLGGAFGEDREIFRTEGEDVFLPLLADATRLGFLVCKISVPNIVDFYLTELGSNAPPKPVVRGATCTFRPLLIPGRLLALTDLSAPNFRVVEIPLTEERGQEWVNIIPETADQIQKCVVSSNHIFVSYVQQTTTRIDVFDFTGRQTDQISLRPQETLRLVPGSQSTDEVLFEQESFAEPVGIFRYSPTHRTPVLWARKNVAFDSGNYDYSQVCYTSKDGTSIPMFLVGRKDILDSPHPKPAIMTSYGGFGLSMTPQFSVFVAFLMERGCVFALPNIRGGAEFGTAWHKAAKRRRRQIAYDDFLGAAEWLVSNGITTRDRLAIFGGSNSGLLVGVALTQRPDLFRAAVCMVPLLDMVRYHLFDLARLWRDEYGTADTVEDFATLLSYSPYHNVKQNTAYPAVLFVSGDSDGNCNPLHARKMAARLQMANASEYPILLDYNTFRGHSPVLPIAERIEALTDRMAFLCDQLRLAT